MDEIFLSVIIPAYNESKRIKIALDSLCAYFKDKAYCYEIIVVNDGSSDDTCNVVGEYTKKFSHITCVDLKENKGKGNAVRYGMNMARGTYRLFMDADNSVDISHFDQFLPHIVEGGYDVVIGSIMINENGHRVHEHNGLHRRILGRLSKAPIRMLATPGIHDTQRGFKLFTKKSAEIIFSRQTIERFGFDIELLVIARLHGFSIKELPVTWDNPTGSTVRLRDYFRTLKELVKVMWNSLLGVYTDTTRVLGFPAHFVPFDEKTKSKKGKGFMYKNDEFVHHTNLHHSETAFYTLLHSQKIIFACIGIVLIGLMVLSWHTTLLSALALITVLYFLDLLFNGFVIYRSFVLAPEITIPIEDVGAVLDVDLPTYTIFCPLYREWRVVPQFAKAMLALDYPVDKLQIIFLLEENDTETIEKVRQADLPKHFEIVVVPHSKPKTKPKAMNYGLVFARGEYLVIYDAEDIPETDQLKKAALAFKQVPENTVCIQAKLNFYNSRQNIMTRIFTAEYSLWFDLVLPGLQSLGVPIPLGGTSNHFKTESLRVLSGWDAFNVTEDCDLGMRIARRGFRTAIIQSTTFEEANSRIINWYKQRSRWVKGYIQTYLVHTRKLKTMIQEKRYREIASFQLIVGGKVLSMFINPIMWLITICYFLLRTRLGPFIESLFPDPVLYLGVFSLIFGNFLYLYYYMVGCAKRGQYDLIKYVFFVPIYWLGMSVAAWRALYEVVVKPHYWAKTIHGLHLTKDKKVSDDVPEDQKQAEPIPDVIQTKKSKEISSETETGRLIPKASTLILASMVANGINLLFNTYLSRRVSLEDFGVVTVLSSVISLMGVVINSCSTAVVHRVSYLSAKWGSGASKTFFKNVRSVWFLTTLAVATVWILLTPFISDFLHIQNSFIVAGLGVATLAAVVDAINRGYLQGNLLFGGVACVVLAEVVSKILSVIGIVETGHAGYAALALPTSMVFSYITSAFLSRRFNKKTADTTARPESLSIPYRFLMAAIVTNLSTVIFISLDVVLAKHYLSPVEAGQYGLLSLVGNMIFFFGSFLTSFIVTFVSRAEGKGTNPRVTFRKIFFGMVGSTTLATVGLIVTAPILLPILFGKNTVSILPYVSVYALTFGLLVISNTLVVYHLARKHYVFSGISITLAMLMLLGIAHSHSSIHSIISIVLGANVLYVTVVSLFHIFYGSVGVFIRNIEDIFGVFGKIVAAPKVVTGKKRILIFNWRDMKHVFAGGAELYIETLARAWAKDGHSVTLFCGNDGQNKNDEIVDGVRVIRRGGFYTVYFCALLYFVFRLKGTVDVVVDCENGIPFFTPLVSDVPVICLLHHVHQDVFRKSLPFPLSFIAQTLEKRLMPMVYRHASFVTVSPSSKRDLEALLSKPKAIDVVYPGIDSTFLTPAPKNSAPLIAYVGRLKAYKSIGNLIRAFEFVLEKIPHAQLVIAGDGEEMQALKTFSEKRNLSHAVTFLGKITEEQKRIVLQEAWIFCNPSSMEGWGITTIEANACGTPVVASDVPGLRDSVRHGETGFLVPYGNIKALAKTLIPLLEDRAERDRLSQGAVVWAKKFLWTDSARKFESIIDRVCSEVVPEEGPVKLSQVWGYDHHEVRKPLSVTVGIPTCYGGESLLPTVLSIRASEDVVIERILIIADRIKIPQHIVNALESAGAEIVWNSVEGSQPKKIKQMVDMCESDILVTTQDDVIFTPRTIAEIISAFNEGNHISMVSTVIMPLAPKTFVESIIAPAIRIPGRIARLWNGGDNHLSASGRCLSFRTNFIKKFRIPAQMVNGDMFLYLENKHLGGIMRHAVESIAYIRAPQTIEDQIGPSSRYQVSRAELLPYFDDDISSEYTLPLSISLWSVAVEMIEHPIATFLYLFVFTYTRLRPQSRAKSTDPLWKPDVSTKSTI